jgi:O-antigen/teichoic acid export membrane protein
LIFDDRKPNVSVASRPEPATGPGAAAVAGPSPVATRSLLSRLYRDAGAIALSSLTAAGLGFLFWAVVARVLSPAQLGVQTAMLAAILGPASVIAPGIGDALNSTVPRHPAHRNQLVRHGYRLFLLLAVPAGLAAGVVVMTALPATRGSLPAGILTCLGVIVWSLFTVQDSALTTFGRARWLPVENALAGTAKLALLPLLLGLAFPVVWATLVPAAIAVVVLVPILERMSRTDAAPGDTRPGPARQARRSLSVLAVRTTSSVALTLGALTFLPFVVTAVAGPEQGAVFALSLSIVSVLDFITAGVSTSLLVHSSANREQERALVRAALTRAVPLVGAAALCLAVSAHEVLRLLNPGYLALHGVRVIVILAATSLLRTGYLIWASRQQARQQLRAVLQLNLVAAVGAYLIVGLSCARWGATGAALALAAAQLVLTGGALWQLLHRRSGQDPTVVHAQPVPAEPYPNGTW